MKNQNGFTLVEVLAVVAILVLVITITAPKIIQSYQKSENTIEKNQIDTIIEISRIYTSKHPELLPNDESEYIITIEDLKNDKLIKNNQIVNPKTKKPLTGCILIKYQNNKYKHEYIEGNDCNK